MNFRGWILLIGLNIFFAASVLAHFDRNQQPSLTQVIARASELLGDLDERLGKGLPISVDEQRDLAFCLREIERRSPFSLKSDRILDLLEQAKTTDYEVASNLIWTSLAYQQKTQRARSERLGRLGSNKRIQAQKPQIQASKTSDLGQRALELATAALENATDKTALANLIVLEFLAKEETAPLAKKLLAPFREISPEVEATVAKLFLSANSAVVEKAAGSLLLRYSPRSITTVEGLLTGVDYAAPLSPEQQRKAFWVLRILGKSAHKTLGESEDLKQKAGLVLRDALLSMAAENGSLPLSKQTVEAIEGYFQSSPEMTAALSNLKDALQSAKENPVETDNSLQRIRIEFAEVLSRAIYFVETEYLRPTPQGSATAQQPKATKPRKKKVETAKAATATPSTRRAPTISKLPRAEKDRRNTEAAQILQHEILTSIERPADATTPFLRFTRYTDQHTDLIVGDKLYTTQPKRSSALYWGALHSKRFGIIPVDAITVHETDAVFQITVQEKEFEKTIEMGRAKTTPSATKALKSFLEVLKQPLQQKISADTPLPRQATHALGAAERTAAIQSARQIFSREIKESIENAATKNKPFVRLTHFRDGNTAVVVGNQIFTTDPAKTAALYQSILKPQPPHPQFTLVEAEKIFVRQTEPQHGELLIEIKRRSYDEVIAVSFAKNRSEKSHTQFDGFQRRLRPKETKACEGRLTKIKAT
ncbi:MAG: hypothetical protein AB1540_04910 [Bdellovibrionota bacterium]